MAITAFYQPASVQEAVKLMYSKRGKGAYVAGGTDLLCELPRPEFVINVRNLLNQVKRETKGFVIGASVTVSQIECWDALAKADGGLLRQCAKDFASRQIRNMATIGGNLASAVPSADFATPLLVLEAQCVIQGKTGRRTVPLEKFFTGPHESVLGKNLLVAIRVPRPASGVRGAFLKIGRNPGDIAVINVSTLVKLAGLKFKKVRIALGAVAPTPVRAYEAEAYLEGKEATEGHIQRAAELAARATHPISDQRASKAYRKQMCHALTRRALQQCLGRDA